MDEIIKIGPRRYRLTAEQWLPHAREDVFPFFADARNLEKLTPPWVGFKIMTPGQIDMKEGALIDYRIRLHGFPVTWRSRITAWEPGTRFIDTQLKGPYRSWIHEHLFEDRNGGTLCRDRIDYEVPFGDWVNRFFVEPDVRKIFTYRRSRMLELFS